MKERFIKDKEEHELLEKKEELKQLKAAEERTRILSQLGKDKLKLLANLDMNAPLDELPDCPPKFEKIIEKS